MFKEISDEKLEKLNSLGKLELAKRKKKIIQKRIWIEFIKKILEE